MLKKIHPFITLTNLKYEYFNCNFHLHINSSWYENNTQGASNIISIFVDDQIVELSERRDFCNSTSESRSINSIAYLTDL